MTDKDIPTLLSEGFLFKVFKAIEDNNEVKVVSWKVKQPSESGTHFMSQLFRVVVNYRVDKNDRTKSIIVKAPLDPDDESDNDLEVMMYKKVFPEMFKLHPWRGVPTAFPSPLPNVIVMEDLKETGYELYPKKQLLDVPYCKQFLITLSTFHAISVRLHQEAPDLVETIGHNAGFVEGSKEFWERYLSKFASMKECVDYAKKIRKTIGIFYLSVSEAFKPSKCLNVLTHNDMWLYNVMFKHDESKQPVNSKLVDFQSPKYCSFASDLIMFWWSSVDAKTREHQEELFEVYRQNLNKILEEVGCAERVSKTDFDSEVKRFVHYPLRPASMHLNFALTDEYYRQLPIVLKQMDEFGVFS